MILPDKILRKAADQIKKATLGLPNAFPWGKKKNHSPSLHPTECSGLEITIPAITSYCHQPCRIESV